MQHALQAHLARRVPPAILGHLRADTDPKTVLGNLQAAFDTFQAKQERRMDGLQSAMTDVDVKLAAFGMNGGGGGGGTPADPEYTQTFASWMRRGQGEEDLSKAHASGARAVIRAAMSVGSGGDGGYLAPVEWDRRILKALASTSALRAICSVVSTTTAGFSTIWNNGQWGSGWVGETASRPQTSTANLAPITFRTGELYAMPATTQQLLEDTELDLENWLSGEIETEFSRQEAIAFVAGDGVNKPQGFLTYFGTGTALHPGGAPDVTPTGDAAKVTPDSLVDLVFTLPAPYRQGAGFVMNSATLGVVRKLKDGQGNYLWQPSYILGQPSTLLGFPVYIEEAMPNVAAGAYPIAFGNWQRFYVINDRLGTSLLRDPYTAKPFVLFYVRKRVGGGIQDPKAVRVLKVGAS